MNIRASAFFLILAAMTQIWAASRGGLEAPPWKHKFGLRWGTALFDGNWVAVFYENQINERWAVRPSIELMRMTERYYDPITPRSLFEPYSNDPGASGPRGMSIDPNYRPVDITRVGVDVECIYYGLNRFWTRRQVGTRLYLLAGLGLHSIKMRHEYARWNGQEMVQRESSDIVPALSVGMGYHINRWVGLEYKYTHSTLNSTFPEDIGEKWNYITLNLRFPVPGLPKGDWPAKRPR